MRSLEHMAKKLDKPASYFLDDADAERARSERELDIGAIAGLLTYASAAEAVRRAEKLLDMGDLSVRDTCRLRLHAGSAFNLLHRGREAVKPLTIAQRLAGELGDEPLVRAARYQLAVATRIAGNPRGAREMLEALLRRIWASRRPRPPITSRPSSGRARSATSHASGSSTRGSGTRIAPFGTTTRPLGTTRWRSRQQSSARISSACSSCATPSR